MKLDRHFILVFLCIWNILFFTHVHREIYACRMILRLFIFIHYIYKYIATAAVAAAVRCQSNLYVGYASCINQILSCRFACLILPLVFSFSPFLFFLLLIFFFICFYLFIWLCVVFIFLVYTHLSRLSHFAIKFRRRKTHYAQRDEKRNNKKKRKTHQHTQTQARTRNHAHISTLRSLFYVFIVLQILYIQYYNVYADVFTYWGSQSKRTIST